MKAFINGKEGDVVRLPKDSNVTLFGRIINDDGTIHPLTTATVDLLVYNKLDRSTTPVATHAATVTTATNGTFTVVIDDSAMTYGPGRFYAYVRRTLAPDVQWSAKPTILDIF